MYRMFIKLYPDQSLNLRDPYIYGFVETEYGSILLILRSGFLMALGKTNALDDLRRPFWPQGEWVQDNASAQLTWQKIVNKIPVDAIVLGTPFQKNVWQALLDLHAGETLSYQQLAVRLEKPKAVRAVANAVGANPISILIPCHQIVRNDGKLGGYRWGLDMKEMLLSKGGSHGGI